MPLAGSCRPAKTSQVTAHPGSPKKVSSPPSDKKDRIALASHQTSNNPNRTKRDNRQRESRKTRKDKKEKARPDSRRAKAKEASRKTASSLPAKTNKLKSSPAAFPGR